MLHNKESKAYQGEQLRLFLAKYSSDFQLFVFSLFNIPKSGYLAIFVCFTTSLQNSHPRKKTQFQVNWCGEIFFRGGVGILIWFKSGWKNNRKVTLLHIHPNQPPDDWSKVTGHQIPWIWFSKGHVNSPKGRVLFFRSLFCSSDVFCL